MHVRSPMRPADMQCWFVESLLPKASLTVHADFMSLCDEFWT